MKSLRLLLASVIVFIFMGVSNTAMAQITIGTGTSSTTSNPITSCYGYSYTEQIYLQSEISAAGTITSISFYVNALPASTANSEDWTIYLGHTTQADYSSTTNWVGANNMTQAYTGTVTYPAAGNWMTLTLTTPFVYNNTDNLVVGAYENTPGYNCSVSFAQTPTTAVDRSIYFRSDVTNPDPLAPPTATATTTNRANIQFGGISQACPAPTALLASNITTTGATLGWTAGGTETNWNIEYGATGFTQGSGTTVAVTANTYALSTLSVNTAYSYYVRAVCGVGDSSLWAGPFSFTTPCVAFTVPYFEGFEAGYTNNTAVAGCLSQENVTGGGFWIANNTFTTYNRAPRTGGWNAFLQYGNEDWIYIPIDLTGGTSYTFGAYARQDGATATNSDVTISYGTANNAAAMTNTIVATTGIINGNYQLLTGIFTPATTGTYYIGIKGYMNGSPWYISLDDISVITTPSCAPPSALAVSAITSSGASLNWTENGTATTWDVEYGAAGFTQGAGTTVAVTAKPYALPTLSPNTAYSYYVRANCGSSSSPWTGPFNFTTSCVAFTVPYFEGFEAGYTNNTAVAGCLSQENVTGGGFWIANNTFTTYNRAPYAGAWNAFLQFGNEDWIYIPIDLTGGTSYTFGAYARQDGATATNSDVTISYGTANNAAAMTNTIVATTGIINGNYQLLTGSFTPTTTGTYYIGIKGYMNGSPWYISLDDISVIATPNCPAPNTLTASNIAATSADLAWVGTGASFEVQYGAAGFTLGTGMMATSATNTASVTGLTFETNYDFYVRAVCAPGDTSPWSGVGSFFTGYCMPAPSSVDGTGIVNVTMDTLNNTTGAETGNYGNYSMMVADATQGGTLPIDITLATSYTYDMWAWIDWNNDLDFTDAGEEFFLGTSAAANPTIFSSSIAIPATALGNYRIRIGGADGGLGTTSPSNPCYSGSYGAFEDYTLNVVIACAVTSSSVITNANCFGGADGSIAITATGGIAPYTYLWNDGQTTATATGLIAAAYNVTVTDTNGCSFVSGGSIGQPLGIALTTISASDTLSASVGTALVVATGGIAPYTYSWSDGQTTDIATGLAMGTYTVTVTDANGCTETETVIVDDFVGTTRIDYITNLSIYPNPTNGNTVIDLELSQNADIAVSIYTITGILVQDFGKENTSKATHTIDVSNYSAGMYLVRFVVDNQVVTKKLLVTK